MDFMNSKTKDTRPQLSDDAASKVLQNVFDACQQEPNTIPLSKLTSYSEYRRERNGFQKFLVGLMILVFMALPLCFIAPQFQVERLPEEINGYPKYEIRMLNSFPVSQVAASVEGEGLTVAEVSDKVYSVVPHNNGTMKVFVRLMNRQYNVTELTVSGIDNEVPILLDDGISDGKLFLRVVDEGLGIDYDGIYAEDTLTGNCFAPLSAEGDCIVFTLPNGSTNIYIPDLKGNTLQLVVSFRSAGAVTEQVITDISSEETVVS